MFASTLPNFLRKSSLIKCLKELTLVADFQLSGRLVQVLNPTYDKLWIHSFVFRKGSFNFIIGRTRNCTIFTNRTEKLIKIARTLIVLKFKNIRNNELQVSIMKV